MVALSIIGVRTLSPAALVLAGSVIGPDTTVDHGIDPCRTRKRGGTEPAPAITYSILTLR